MNQTLNITTIVSTVCVTISYTIYKLLCYVSDSCTINIRFGRVTFGRPNHSNKPVPCSMPGTGFLLHNNAFRACDNSVPQRYHCCTSVSGSAEPFCDLAYQVGSCYMLGGPDQGPSSNKFGSEMTERCSLSYRAKIYKLCQ